MRNIKTILHEENKRKTITHIGKNKSGCVALYTGVLCATSKKRDIG